MLKRAVHKWPGGLGGPVGSEAQVVQPDRAPTLLEARAASRQARARARAGEDGLGADGLARQRTRHRGARGRPVGAKSYE